MFDKTQKQIGLAATGSAGLWSIDLDETLNGPDRWYLQVEGRSIYLYFEIRGPGVLNEMLGFFAGSHEKEPTLTIAHVEQQKVELVHENELPDRCFLKYSNGPATQIHLTLVSGDLTDFIAALQQASGMLG